MNPSEILARLVAWADRLPLHTQILLTLATCVLVGEIAFRKLAPRSAAYRKWTAAFVVVGTVWTAIILSIVYFTSVSIVGIGMKLLGKDPLDRGLRPELTFWRTHEPNPLGPAAATRHQF